MPRYATIDVGTNSVLLLIAEKIGPARFEPVVERAEITRLGRGVDGRRLLSKEGIAETVEVIKAFATEARELGVNGLVVCATSAARDANNAGEFLLEAKRLAQVDVEVLPGQLEAQLSFAAAVADFGGQGPLAVIDIGGGSTEIIVGQTGLPEPSFRHSFDLGAVRLTERYVRSDPPSSEERARMEALLQEQLADLPSVPSGVRAVGIAGTVTTLYSVLHQVEPYDAALVHGHTLAAGELAELIDRLFSLPLEERRRLPGLQPKRADVICAGALVLKATLEALGVDQCLVSDRGLRWGLMQQRFGGHKAH